MHGPTPFVIVIRDIKRIISAPPAARLTVSVLAQPIVRLLHGVSEAFVGRSYSLLLASV
ncbi:MAG: hypothetical protein ACKOI3_03335 [Actinomycetota bacterium]